MSAGNPTMRGGARFVLLLALLVPGCAANQVAHHARTLAGLTNKVSTEGTRVAAARDRLAKARQGVVSSVVEDAAQLESEIADQVDRWKLTGETEQGRVYHDLLGMADAQMKRSVALSGLLSDQQGLAASIRSAVAFPNPKLEEMAKLLAQLGEQKSVLDQMRFYYTFIWEVAAAMQRAKLQTDTLESAVSNRPSGLTGR